LSLGEGHRWGKVVLAFALAFLLATTIAAGVSKASAYSPQKGDYFDYSETIVVNNGQGSYSGYTDQTQVTGMEEVNNVVGSTVSSSYSYSSQFSNNQGASSTNSSSGQYTWSSSALTYINGTDNQFGYSQPVYVWFAMNPSLAVGSTFEILNTQFSVLSKNFSVLLPTEGNKYVQAVQTKGTGLYQRDDSYGVFNASYTWYAYFDPVTGYIVGYSYLEQDNGQYQGTPGSFTYNDTLYVTSTSYTLALAAPPSQGSGSGSLGMAPYLVYIVALVVVVVIVGIIAYSAGRRRRKDTLPKHSYAPPTPPPQPAPPSEPFGSRIDLGSKPTEEVVIREVAKVNCKFCGTLIPTTAERCPYCGAPRQ